MTKSGYMTAVPATGLRGRLALRLAAWMQRKAEQQASGDLCTACGHDALYHQARNFREHRKAGVPRGACVKCDHQEHIGLLPAGRAGSPPLDRALGLVLALRLHPPTPLRLHDSTPDLALLLAVDVVFVVTVAPLMPLTKRYRRR